MRTMHTRSGRSRQRNTYTVTGDVSNCTRSRTTASGHTHTTGTTTFIVAAFLRTGGGHRARMAHGCSEPMVGEDQQMNHCRRFVGERRSSPAESRQRARRPEQGRSSWPLPMAMAGPEEGEADGPASRCARREARQRGVGGGRCSRRAAPSMEGTGRRGAAARPWRGGRGDGRAPGAGGGDGSEKEGGLAS